MTTIQDYLIPKVFDTLDLSKVLLILNSSVSWDADIATYYQNARGLTVDHRLSFSAAELAAPLGTGNPILNTVANYITYYGIKAVFCMPNIPQTVGHLYSFVGAESCCFDAVFGAAIHFKNDIGYFGYVMANLVPLVAAFVDGGANYLNPSGTATTPQASMTLKTPDGNGYNVIKTVDPSKFLPGNGSNYVIAWGRLGYPYWNDATAIAHSIGKAQTYADVKRMIDDCIYAESQPIASKTFCLGFGDYVQQGTHVHQWYSWQFAKTAGLQCKVYTNDAAGTGLHGLPTNVRNNLTGWLGQPNPDYDSTAVFNGTASLVADYYSGGAVLNDGIAGVFDGVFGTSDPYAQYYNSLAPKRGAWAFNWCSAGQWFVENLIRKGGAAGIGPVFEPYTIGLPDEASVISLALKGYSLCEILLYGGPLGWAMTAFGDPMYRPFKYTPPNLIIGLANTFEVFTASNTLAVAYTASNITLAPTVLSSDVISLNVGLTSYQQSLTLQEF
jgi:hypothetical protein